MDPEKMCSKMNPEGTSEIVEIEALKKKIVNLNTELRTWEEKNKLWKSERSKRNAERDAYELVIKQLRLEMEEMRADALQRNLIFTLEKKRDMEQICTLGKEKETLSTTLKGMKKEMKALKKRLSTLESSHSALEESHSALEASHLALETSHSALEASHLALETSHLAMENRHLADRGTLLSAQIVFSLKTKVDAFVFRSEKKKKGFKSICLKTVHEQAMLQRDTLLRWKRLNIQESDIEQWDAILQLRSSTAHPKCVHGFLNGVCPVSQEKECIPTAEELIKHIADAQFEMAQCESLLKAMATLKIVNKELGYDSTHMFSLGSMDQS